MFCCPAIKSSISLPSQCQQPSRSWTGVWCVDAEITGETVLVLWQAQAARLYFIAHICTSAVMSVRVIANYINYGKLQRLMSIKSYRSKNFKSFAQKVASTAGKPICKHRCYEDYLGVTPKRRLEQVGELGVAIGNVKSVVAQCSKYLDIYKEKITADRAASVPAYVGLISAVQTLELTHEKSLLYTTCLGE